MSRPSRQPAAHPRTVIDIPRTDRAFLPWAGAIFGVALAVRLLHVWLLSRSPFFDALMGDARGYDEWARRLAGGDWIGGEVFYQAPLYPYFLGVTYKVFGHSLWALRVVQALVGAGTCALLGLAAYRFFSVRVGLIAGLALALYAPAIFFDALIQKSVLDQFFICLSLWLIGRLVDEPGRLGSWLGTGLAMGGMSLTRENALVFVAVMATWALVLTGSVEPPHGAAAGAKGFPRRRMPSVDRAALSRLGAFAMGLAIVLLPVAVRNYAVGGGFYLTTSQFGPNFYIGNNPRADGTYASLRYGRGAPEYERTDATELAEHALKRTLTPAEVSAYWTDQALAFIAGDPGAWLTLTGRKVLLLFNATEMLDTEAQESHAEWSWPLRIGGWVGHFGLLVPMAVFGFVLCWPARRRLAILYVMLAAYTASVVMFYVFARYRLPLVPMLLIFAAGGLASAPEWFRSQASLRTRAAAGAAVLAAAIFTNWPMLSRPLMMAITETNLAVALQADGRVEDAAAHYARAIDLQPDYAPAYNNLGVLQRSLGRVDDAIATYERAVSLKGDYPDAHYNLANALLEKGRPQEAAEHFTIALQSIPDSAGAANNLGVALAGQNRPDAAIAAFRAATAAEPDSAIAHRNLADALASAGQVEGAVSEFRRAMALDPQDPAAPYNLGVVLLEAGRPAEAIGALRTAVALAPESVDARNNLGIALGSSGDLQGAIAEFRRALSLNPSSGEARRNLEMAEGALAGSRP
ncbi:MAG: tetratricopeptide repeat protein [Vicinamibacterales bacterium]